jgi:hypothetical protein
LPFFGGLMQESQRNDYFKLKKKIAVFGTQEENFCYTRFKRVCCVCFAFLYRIQNVKVGDLKFYYFDFPGLLGYKMEH